MLHIINRKYVPLINFIICIIMMFSACGDSTDVATVSDLSEVLNYDSGILKNVSDLPAPPADAAELFNDAAEKNMKGQFQESIESLNRALEIFPEYVDAYVMRAKNKISLKDYQGAIADCNSALSIAPLYEGAYVNRALAYYFSKSIASSLYDFTTSTQLNPSNYWSYFNRRHILLEKGAKDEAFIDTINFLNIAPQNDSTAAAISECKTFLAEQLALQIYDIDENISMGRYQASLQDLENFTKIIANILPEWTPAFIEFQKARVYAGLSNTDLSLAALKKAVRLGWDSYTAIQNDPLFIQFYNDTNFQKIYGTIAMSPADCHELEWLQIETKYVIHETNIMIIENISRKDNGPTLVFQTFVPDRNTASLTVKAYRDILRIKQKMQKNYVNEADIKRIKHLTNMYILGYSSEDERTLSATMANNKALDRQKRVRDSAFTMIIGLSFNPAPAPDLTSDEEIIGTTVNNYKVRMFIKGKNCINSDANKAIEYFNLALNYDSAYADAYYWKGLTYLNRNDFIEARDNITTAITLTEGSPVATYFADRAVCNYYLKNFTDAVSDASYALSLDVDNPRIIVNRAEIYIALNELDNAEKDLFHALELEGNNKGFIHYNLARIYSKKENSEEALEQIDLALQNGFVQFNPQGEDEDLNFIKDTLEYKKLIRNEKVDIIKHLYNAGTRLYKYKKYKAAEPFFKRVVQLDSKNEEAYHDLSNIYVQLGTFEKIPQLYEDKLSSFALNKNDAVIHFDCALAYYKLGKYEESIKFFDKVIKLRKKSFVAYKWRGMAYYNLNDLNKSISDFAVAINLEPTNPEVNLLLASWFARANNNIASLSSLEMAFICGYEKFDDVYTFTEFQTLKDTDEFRSIVEKYRNNYK